jgi:hypothetical protein
MSIAGAALLDACGQAVPQLPDDVLGGRGVHGRGEGVVSGIGAALQHRAQRAGEQRRVVVGQDDARAHPVRRDLPQRRPAPGHGGWCEAGEPLKQGGGVLGPRADNGGEHARLDAHSGIGIVQASRRRWRVRRVRLGLMAGDEGEEAQQPPGGHQRAADLVAALDEGGHRHDEDRGVPVHRDELPDRDGALGRHPRRQPGHAGQEHRWQPDREAADPAGYAGDPVAVIAQRPRVGAVALRVGGLAAEGIEHAQATPSTAGARRR